MNFIVKIFLWLNIILSTVAKVQYTLIQVQILLEKIVNLSFTLTKWI